MNAYPVKRGETRVLHVERLALGGRGVARVEGYTVFVERGLPGQEVEAMILRRRKSYAEARVVRVLSPGPREVEPRCAHFGVCGGCALQHLEVAAQAEAKGEQVVDCLVRLGGMAAREVEVLPPLPSPRPFEYRNKMEYSFSTRWLTEGEVAAASEADRFGLGLHVPRRYDRVVNVERCHLQSETASAVVRAVRAAARESGLPVYSTRTHLGFWRFLVIRETANTAERMVLVITHRAPPGSREARAVDALGRRLWTGGFGVTSLLHGVTESRGSVAVCEEVRVLAGEPVIRESLLGFTYEIGPNTFFQTNTLGAEALFGEALRMARVGTDDVVWDLYCGAGALTLPLARQARSVLGVELVPEAIAAAERNAAANGVGNVSFAAGDVREVLASGAHPAPDLVVMDPPREGVHARVLETVVAAAPRRIVYVSCNPATLARDLAVLREAGYRLGPVRPVDLFPHTPHVECVCALERGEVA